jgi:hypothetical protein
MANMTEATRVPPTLVLAPLTCADHAQIDRLDERAFGHGRFTRTAHRLREGVPPDASLSFVAGDVQDLAFAAMVAGASCRAHQNRASFAIRSRRSMALHSRS